MSERFWRRRPWLGGTPPATSPCALCGAVLRRDCGANVPHANGGGNDVMRLSYPAIGRAAKARRKGGLTFRRQAYVFAVDGVGCRRLSPAVDGGSAASAALLPCCSKPRSVRPPRAGFRRRALRPRNKARDGAVLGRRHGICQIRLEFAEPGQ